MKDYYFTFGQDHWHKDGNPMRDCWVRVTATDFLTARHIFIEQFSSVFMQAPDKWAGQYDDSNWRPDYFPSGEFQHIEQPDNYVIPEDHEADS